MKTKITLIVGLLIGLFAGLLGTGIFVTMSGEGILLQEIKSPYDFEKTVKIMEERISSTPGWHVIKVFDYNSEVKNGGGQDIGNYAIIEFCKASTAAEMLSEDSRKKIGAMLPKRFSIYEKKDGKVYIGAGNGPIMVQLFSGETRTIAQKVSREIQRMLIFRTNQL
jgi:uncharacterized protein (DUF302 family)